MINDGSSKIRELAWRRIKKTRKTDKGKNARYKAFQKYMSFQVLVYYELQMIAR